MWRRTNGHQHERGQRLAGDGLVHVSEGYRSRTWCMQLKPGVMWRGDRVVVVMLNNGQCNDDGVVHVSGEYRPRFVSEEINGGIDVY